MERYILDDVYDVPSDMVSDIKLTLTGSAYLMGKSITTYDDILLFICTALIGYFYDDVIAYNGETLNDVRATFLRRVTNDIGIKLPYYYKKYNYIKKLLTTEELSLLQTSKMTSSSSDATDTASGTLQKTATTPTGVSAEGSEDSFDIAIDSDGQTANTQVETTGFADKYSNAQQKFATAGKVNSQREGEILREGSIEELVNVLEKLPSSFANEINKDFAHHFIFDYEMVEGEY